MVALTERKTWELDLVDEVDFGWREAMAVSISAPRDSCDVLRRAARPTCCWTSIEPWCLSTSAGLSNWTGNFRSNFHWNLWIFGVQNHQHLCRFPRLFSHCQVHFAALGESNRFWQQGRCCGVSDDQGRWERGASATQGLSLNVSIYWLTSCWWFTGKKNKAD